MLKACLGNHSSKPHITFWISLTFSFWRTVTGTYLVKGIKITTQIIQVCLSEKSTVDLTQGVYFLILSECLFSLCTKCSTILKTVFSIMWLSICVAPLSFIGLISIKQRKVRRITAQDFRWEFFQLKKQTLFHSSFIEEYVVASI